MWAVARPFAIGGITDMEGSMLRTSFLLVATAMGVASAQNAPDAASAPAADPTRVLVSAGIPGVVAPGTKTEFVRGGLKGTEGVIRMPDGSTLFCEQEENRIIRIDFDGNFSTYLEDTNRSIGLAYDHAGRLIATQSRDPRIAVLAPNRMTLVDSFEGQPLVKPNDIVIDRKGGIYFSDPLSNVKSQFREPPPGRKSLMLYVRPDGTVIKPTDAIVEPHKLTLSPDEKTFYAGDGDHLVALDVRPDGRLVNPRRFAAISAEALAIDEAGRLYVSIDDGIEVLSPAGKSLGRIPTPIRIQNFAFSGKDRKTIYAVGRGNVYRISMLAAGFKGRQK